MRPRRFAVFVAIATVLTFAAAPSAAAQPTPGDQPHIIGGHPAADGEYPFMASLQLKAAPGTGLDKHFCGGTLIDPFTVLTAAHCVAGSKAKDIRAVVGTSVLTSGQGETRNVRAVDSHPKFSFPNYDAAVLALDEPVQNVDAPLLPTPGTDALERPGTTATVIGWGNTIEQSTGNPGSGNEHYPDRLQEVAVPLVSRAECRAAYQDVPIDDTLVCAGVTHKDACQGDSGGPLLVPGTLDDGRKAWFQVGIVSGGTGCAGTGNPGYYARVGNAEIGEYLTGG